MTVIDFIEPPCTMEESLAVFRLAAKGLAAAADIDGRAQRALMEKPDNPTVQELANEARALLHDAINAIDVVLAPVREQAAGVDKRRAIP